MYLGYVLGDNTLPLLKQITEDEAKKTSFEKPLLIVGYEKAFELFPQLTKPNNRIIDKKRQIYYTYSKQESETSYASQTSKFLKRTFGEIVKNITVKNIIDPSTINLERFKDKRVFLYETDKLITISTKEEIYFFNKEISSFFSQEKLTADFLSNLFSHCELWSWDRFRFLGARLKSNFSYKSKDQLRHLLKPYGDVELYMGILCLKWLDELTTNEYEETWQRAYEVETYLSNLPVKINRKEVLLLSYHSESSMFENMIKQEEEGYIYQQYNGTDKITGRMYAKGSGFSMQTLTHNLRHIIIAEPECYLVEFDYKYFEYSLLRQMCNIPIKGDPHKELAIELFGNETYRDAAKEINYGILYGKSLETTAVDLISSHKLLLTEEELLKRLRELGNPIEKLKRQLAKVLVAQGYVVNPLRRPITPEKAFAVLNNFVQSTAADIVINKILKIRDYLKKYSPYNRIVLQNHDSILLNLTISDVENTEMASDLKRILEEPEKNLSGKVSLKYGVDWKSLK